MSERPKRPLSAYMLWLCSARPKIKAQYPGIRPTDVAKKGGQIWRSMTDKRAWQEKAQRLREQYMRDLEKYKACRTALGSTEGATRKRTRRARSMSSCSTCSHSDDSA